MMQRIGACLSVIVVGTVFSQIAYGSSNEKRAGDIQELINRYQSCGNKYEQKRYTRLVHILARVRKKVRRTYRDCDHNDRCLLTGCSVDKPQPREHQKKFAYLDAVLAQLEAVSERKREWLRVCNDISKMNFDEEDLCSIL